MLASMKDVFTLSTEMAKTNIIVPEGVQTNHTSVIVSYSNGIDSTGALYWEAYLKRQNFIDVVQLSNDVGFQVYQGKRVIIDDGCPAVSGVYTTYLFGGGAIALGNGSPTGFVPTETD